MIVTAIGIFGVLMSLALLSSCFFVVQPNQARFVFNWIESSVNHTSTTSGLKIKMP